MGHLSMTITCESLLLKGERQSCSDKSQLGWQLSSFWQLSWSWGLFIGC
jgi:hypothetical protein